MSESKPRHFNHHRLKLIIFTALHPKLSLVYLATLLPSLSLWGHLRGPPRVPPGPGMSLWRKPTDSVAPRWRQFLGNPDSSLTLEGLVHMQHAFMKGYKKVRRMVNLRTDVLWLMREGCEGTQFCPEGPLINSSAMAAAGGAAVKHEICCFADVGHGREI